MDSVKISKDNFQIVMDGTVDSQPTRVLFFNKLWDDVKSIFDTLTTLGIKVLANIPSNGVAKMDTINEYTSGSGITIDSVLIKDGKVRATNAITANATGGNSAIISAIEQTVVITSPGLTSIVSLPLLASFVTGAHIQGFPVNTGCELMVHPTDRVAGVTLNGVTGGNYLAVNNGTGCAYFDAVKTSLTKWIVTTWSNLGAPTTIVPSK
jgi:hypothetical protein